MASLLLVEIPYSFHKVPMPTFRYEGHANGVLDLVFMTHSLILARKDISTVGQKPNSEQKGKRFHDTYKVIDIVYIKR